MPPITASLKRVGPSFIIPTSKRPPVVDEASCTNVTFSTLTNPDGDGKNYRLAVWNSNGNFVLTRGGVVQALLVQGGWNGGGGTNNTGVGGQGGNVLPLEALLLDPGTIAITVGAGAVAAQTSVAGGHSSIGSTSTSDGRALPGGNGGDRSATNDAGHKGIPTRITGSVLAFAGGGGSGGGGATNGSESLSSSGGADGRSSVVENNGLSAVANKGGGGGGFWANGTYSGGAGGSGKVMVRWEV